MLPVLFFFLCFLRIGDLFILIFWMAALDDCWNQDAVPSVPGLPRLILSRLAFAVFSIAVGTVCVFVVHQALVDFVLPSIPPPSDLDEASDEGIGFLAHVLATSPTVAGLQAWLLRRAYGTAWTRAFSIGIFYVLCVMVMWIVLGLLTIRLYGY